MRPFALLLTLFTALCATPPATADAVSDAIKRGGVALLMRHASAPGMGDPEQFRLNDCSTQRNLSAEGRSEATRIGRHLAHLGLVPGEVLTSQWCRCRETAKLAFGGGKDWPALNSFFNNRQSEDRQTADVLARIATIKPGDRPLVLVTHQVIVTSVTGVFPESGEVVVVRASTKDGKPGVTVIGSVKPESAK
jgi:phosphohistidine phosphatase SixA